MQEEQIVTVPETTMANPDAMVNAMPASKMQMKTRSMLRSSRSSAATNKDSKMSKASDAEEANPEQEPLVSAAEAATTEGEAMAAAEAVVDAAPTETTPAPTDAQPGDGEPAEAEKAAEADGETVAKVEAAQGSMAGSKKRSLD